MAQGTNTTFGKNVIQYTDFDWAYYQTDNFDVYFYQNGRELGRYILTNGQKYLKDLETRLDYPLGEKITFIVYNSYTDYRQSNYHASESVVNTGGKTHVSGNKAFLYFNGSHLDFDQQIRSAIAQVLLQDIFYGGSLQERLQSNVLLNLPSWYIDGLVRYLAGDWTPIMENQLRTGILSGRFKKFKNISDEQAAIISQSLWRFIAAQYGQEAIANIIYILRANKSVEAGYLFVLGKDFETLYNDWYNFYRMRYGEGKLPEAGTELNVLNKTFSKGEVTRVEVSPRGDYAAVVTNNQGKAKVWVVNLATGKRKKVFSEGYRRGGNLFDYNYPVIAWNTRQSILTVIYEDKVTPTYIQYNAEEDKKEKPQIMTRIERVLSCSYSPNGRTAALSVVRRGQTDVITFDFRSQQQRNITDDIYDDLEPRFARNGLDIAFTSNRPDATMGRVTSNQEYTFSDNWDIFYLYNYEQRGSANLKQVTFARSNETTADAWDTTFISYLTDENGVLNMNAARLDSIFNYTRLVISYKDTTLHKNDTFRYNSQDIRQIRLPAGKAMDTAVLRIDTALIYRDTVYNYPQTDYSGDILSYSILPKANSIYELIYSDGRYKLFKLPRPGDPVKSSISRTGNYILKTKQVKPGKDKKPAVITTQPLPRQQDSASAGKPYFQTGFTVPENYQTYAPQEDNSGQGFLRLPNGRIRYPSASPYEQEFKLDYTTAQLDNGLLNSPYVPFYSGDLGIYNPILNGMIKFGLSDLMRDYRLVAGFRVPVSLQGAEYFMLYDNLKHRLDKRTMFYRRGEVKSDGGGYYRETSNELREELRWPFSEISSVRGAMFGRVDNKVYLSGEKTSLMIPSEPVYWGGLKGEYVFDNTIDRGLNLMSGLRAKGYVEFFNAFNRKKTLFTVLGADIRDYQPLFRQIIWANRFSAASSIGPAKVAYFLGGVDNWLFPKFDRDNLVDPSQNFVYKALAAPVRGFNQNIRNGNSYAVFNSELRIPVVRFIFNRPFGNQFLQNLQLIAFGDAGTAWNGIDPFSIQNAYQKRIIQRTPFTVTVINMRDPIVYGYGFGVRTLVFGYFLRLDFAHGVENGERQPRKIYLSIGTDF
jgi:Tol biopolymer transport system component